MDVFYASYACGETKQREIWILEDELQGGGGFPHFQQLFALPVYCLSEGYQLKPPFRQLEAADVSFKQLYAVSRYILKLGHCSQWCFFILFNLHVTSRLLYRF